MPTDEKFGLHTRVSDILYPFTDLDIIESSVLNNASSRGSLVHTVIESILEGTDLLDLDNRIWEYVNKYPLRDMTPKEQFSSEKLKIMLALDSFYLWYPGKKFIEKPTRFFCDEYLITGECDGVYEASDGLVLVDYKTPASEKKSWLLQGSAYSYMARQAGYDIKRIEFVKLSKSGAEPRVFTYVEDFPLFLAHLQVYNYQYRGKNEPDENPLDFL